MTDSLASAFAGLRDRYRNDPSDRTPIDWRQIIQFGDGFSEAQRRTLEESFDRVARTETGQEMFRTMLQRADQDHPLQVVRVEGNSFGPQMVYDSSPHHIEVRDSFFVHAEREGITFVDPYVAHELGHAATHDRDTFHRADAQTTLDFWMVVGAEEREAENFSARVSEELGYPRSQPYVSPEHQARYQELILESRDDPQSVEGWTRRYLQGDVTQAVIDGADREGVRARIDNFVERMQREHGLDLRETVARVLQRPAPRFDEHDREIETDRRPEGMAGQGANVVIPDTPGLDEGQPGKQNLREQGNNLSPPERTPIQFDGSMSPGECVAPGCIPRMSDIMRGQEAVR